MISVTGVTDRYALQPRLIAMHKESLEWLSASILWRRELDFMQKLLDDHAQAFTSVEDKKEIDHYQHLILYYQGELIETLRRKLRDHENHLAKVLHDRIETDTEYLNTHDDIIDEVRSFDKQFQDFKQGLFTLIERVL